MPQDLTEDQKSRSAFKSILLCYYSHIDINHQTEVSYLKHINLWNIH